MNLENSPKVYNFLKERETINIFIKHEHNEIYEDNLCVYCADVEDTEQYKSHEKIMKRVVDSIYMDI